MAAAAKPAKPAYELSGWERFKKDVVRDKWLYLLILPGMLFMLIFRYIPIFGNVIAFMDFNPYNMWNSTWVGFDQFIKLFNKPAFMQTFYNTLYISILKMVCGFPIPIILALMMNEMRNMQFKKVAQTLLYLPHFISWVVMAGLIMNFLDPSTGLITALLKSITGKDLQVLTDKTLFVPMLISPTSIRRWAGARLFTSRRCPVLTRSFTKQPRLTVHASGSRCSTSRCRRLPRRLLSC